MAKKRNERKHLRRLGAELRQEAYEAAGKPGYREDGYRAGRKVREGEVKP